MLTQLIVTTLPLPAFPAALRYIQSGVDGLGSTSHQLQAKDLADAIGWLHGQVNALDPTSDVASRSADNAFSGANEFDNITVGFGAKYKLSSRSITRVVPHIGTPNNGTDWTCGTDGTWSQVTTATSTVALAFALDLPNNSILTSVSVEIIGAGGHAGAPTLLPDIELLTISSAGVTATIATNPDTYPSAGVYQAAHSITISSGALGGGITIDKTTKRYVVRFRGEGGTNFVAGLKVYAVSYTATVQEQDDGAA